MNFLFVCFSKGLKVIHKLRQTDIRCLRIQAQIRLSLSAAEEARFGQDKVQEVKSQTHIDLLTSAWPSQCWDQTQTGPCAQITHPM